MRWILPPLLLGLALIASCGGPDRVEDRARQLEGRLVAPCCWQQTLDTHASPLVSELRAEIRRRLAAGESAEAVEADLIQRHGERIRAVPEGWSLDRSIGWPAIVLIALAGAGVVLVAARWVRRGRRRAAGEPGAAAAAAPRASDELEDRLDQELADLN
jgi:cytochrome c-type biogenesis protein CcmH